MSSLTLEQAAKITDAALAEGARRKFAPLCVVVLDPGGHVLVLKRTDPEPAPGSRDKVSFRVLHATTPVNPSRMHYFWFFAFDLPLTEAQIEKVRALTVVGFAEDDAMISAVQQMMELDPRSTEYPEIMVATDRSAVEARRALERQLERTSPSQKVK